MGIAIDHLGCEVESGAVAAVSVDDDQLCDAVPCSTHADFINQPGKGIRTYAYGAAEIFMVIRDPIGHKRQDKGPWLCARFSNTPGEIIGIKGV